MISFLKSYRLTLTTLGPVHIGSGEKRTAKEYIQLSQTVHFPDMATMYADLVKRGKDRAFEGFMLNSPVGGNRHGQQIQAAQRLAEWCKQQGLQIGPDLLKAWGCYSVELGDLRDTKRTKQRASQQSRLNDILTFIKDGYGNPYIPGSSVKGLIRGLILEYLVTLLEDRDKRPHADERTNADILEAKLFRTLARNEQRSDDAVNDVFQLIRVSDSRPLATTDLMVCQKIDTNTKDDPAGLPLFRECLKPGVSISFDVTVDTSLEAKVLGIALTKLVQNLSNIADKVYASHHRHFINEFAPEELEGLAVHEKGPYVYLGGGAGFRSKSVVNNQRAMSIILDKQFNRLVPHLKKTEQTGVSPLVLKLTKLQGKYYEMGKCSLSIEPMES